MAGGGLKHGQVIGATDSRGGGPVSSVVRPQDLAATVFRHMGIDQKTHWINPQGRPIPGASQTFPSQSGISNTRGRP
jgi:hypothetical protein